MRPLLLPLLLTACVAVPGQPHPALAPALDPIRFFEGCTEGEASLRVALHRTVPVHVHGRGRVEPDGTLVLDQIIERAAKPATRRQWRLRAAGDGRYTGTLTEAVGPVAVDAVGNRIHIAFRLRHGLRVEQWLTLAPDGASARNLLVVRKAGLTLARLEETIRRVAP